MNREIGVVMKRLIVQVCAMLFCTGMFVPEVLALSIDRHGSSGRFEMTSPSQPALSAPAGRPVILAGLQAGDDRDPGLEMNAGMADSRVNGDVLGADAAERLFGAGSPGDRGTPCSIDSGTMCIAQSFHVYPIIGKTFGNPFEEVMWRIREASVPAASQGSLVLEGLALIGISVLWRRKGGSATESETADRPVAPVLHIPVPLEETAEAKAHSLAA
jgi:hypothetical protein